MPFTSAAHRGTLHHFAPRLFAFEHAGSAQNPASAADAPSPQPLHTLLFLGGLGDDLLHPTYPSKLPPHLPASWRVAELHLASSGKGWTTSNLARDADDLGSAVAYFRSLPGRSASAGARIALMGHSTGAQCCMEYLTSRSGAGKRARPRVDGVVLQGGVSDREGLVDLMGAAELAASVEVARDWVRGGRGADVLPDKLTGLAMGSSPSARRWVSLAGTGEGADDDFFSSDLGAEGFRATFGLVARSGVPMLCLLSGRDENMPAWVDKEALLAQWKDTVVGEGGVWDDGSAVVQDAAHNLNKSDPGIVADLCQRVANFVEKVGSGWSEASRKDEKL